MPAGARRVDDRHGVTHFPSIQIDVYAACAGTWLAFLRCAQTPLPPGPRHEDIAVGSKPPFYRSEPLHAFMNADELSATATGWKFVASGLQQQIPSAVGEAKMAMTATYANCVSVEAAAS